MGCRDRESNFRRLVHSGGSWGMQWGSIGVEAEDKAILLEKLEQPPHVNYNWRVSYNEADKRWVAELVDDTSD